MLNFQPLTLGMKTLADSYTFKYGEGSCQHSFVSSWSLRHKYGDEFCEHDGFLYTLRRKLCSDGERVYLFPLGPRDDTDALRQAVQNVIDDAHSHNCRVKFRTVTESAKDIITAMFPGRFTAEFNRDYSEYVCNVDELFNLDGHGRAVKRKNIHQFHRVYEGRYEARLIAPEHIDMVRDFQDRWLEDRLSAVDDPAHAEQLRQDNECIQCVLDDFFELGVSGIVMFVDGKLAGYSYGFPLSDTVFEADAEKADRNIPAIYTAIKHEFLRMCMSLGFTYCNFEEDLGDEGLRTLKTRDRPSYMIDKFTVTEK